MPLNDFVTSVTIFLGNRDVKAGDYLSHGWPRTVYGVSKLGVSLVTAMLQQDIDADKSRSDVIFNSVRFLCVLLRI